MLRCPNCGQSYWAKVQGSDIEIVVALDGQSISANKEYHESPEDELFCPRCKKSASLTKWQLCWKDPLPYLEMEKEELCRCGGEIIYQVSYGSALKGKNNTDPGRPTSSYSCERCGLAFGKNPSRYPDLSEISLDEE